LFCVSNASRGAPQSWLERELLAQGTVLAARTEPGWQQATAAASLLAREDVGHVVIAGRGTSDNAARYAQYLWGLAARLPVGLAAPWLYMGEGPPRLQRGAAVAISQSGRSPDIVAVLAAARAQRRPTIAITNDASSALAAQADVVVELRAGLERSVAATKTYLASLHAVAQIAAVLSGRSKELDGWYARLPEIVGEVVREQLAERTRFDAIAGSERLTVVGRGLHLATAFETALKIRELSGAGTEAFSPPDLMHGPIAALDASTALWFVNSAGERQPGAAEFAAMRAAGGISVAVTDDPAVLSGADIRVPLPSGLPGWAAPLVAVIPGQVAALRLGELAGTELDRPSGLRKVTMTR
jgi:glucosamine--fructose-6-phosphate aminotransferase (isomerizing)